MFNWIKKVLRILTNNNIKSDVEDKKQEDSSNYVWCLIGNIIDEHLAGNEKELKHGTKHFSPQTKVYCLPPQWGDGYENIKVIGRHKGSKRYVTMVIPSKLVSNWRLQKVFRPYILKVMKSQFGWTNSNKDKESILEMLKWLPYRAVKMED